MHALGCKLIVAVAVMLVVMQAQGAGILAPTDVSLPPLRVTEHSVDVTVQDQVALTTLNQTFHNDTSRVLEATYVFPLPENADLTDFQMSFNGKMVQGEVLPAAQARQIYESIVRQTRDPGLIEFIGHRLLQMRVFPIEPGKDTKIQVKYQQICRSMSGMSAYHYPLRTAKACGQVYGNVRFNVKLTTTSPLKNVWSPTHSVEIVRQGENAAAIAYEASKGSLDEDFLLLYDTDSSDLGLSVIAYKPSENRPGHFVLTLTPKQLWPKQDHQPQDVVFVIDTSGSMSGEKLEQAQAALKYCVDQLDERDRFNLVRFSTGVDPLFQEVQPATRENRERARERIARFAAAGGTNITDALKAALDLRSVGQDAAKDADPRPPFIIVFITDGMGNASAQDTLKVVKEHPASPDARIFSFGVGHDVNTLFLDQLATTFAGKPTYVQPGENLELVLGDFFAVISQPVLTNLKLALPEVGITERFPATLGDLYHGQQLIIAGKFENAGSGPVKLTATRNGEVQEFIWKDVSFNHTPQAKYVPAIWAGRKIAFLIDEIRAHGESKEMVDEVVTLGQEYGIQTPYTSWLVNPDQPRIVAGRPMRSPQDPMVRERASRAMQGAGFEELKSNASPATSSGREPAPADLLRQQSGESATTLAMQNARMRDSRSADDGGRVDETQLGSRDIAGRRYNRIGKFLVDEAFDEQTRTTIVRFGSNAYFELVAARPELQPAFAASRNIVLRWRENEAVIIAEDRGIEDLSPDQLKQLGLDARTD